jgi:type II secretory pathway pseudopilin PulG
MCKSFLKEKVVRRSKKRATTFIELMVVTSIMIIVMGAVLIFLTMSDSFWEIGQNKLVEQQQASNTMSDIADLLQYSSPEWTDASGNNYPVSLSNSRIDFYVPVFYASCCPDNCPEQSVCIDVDGSIHSDGEIASLTKVTYKIDPNDSSKMLKKVGNNAETIVANDINTIAFDCGCSGCSAVDNICPVVDITITTQREAPYSLRSKIALRNQNRTLDSAVEIEEPQEGEF